MHYLIISTTKFKPGILCAVPDFDILKKDQS